MQQLYIYIYISCTCVMYIHTYIHTYIIHQHTIVVYTSIQWLCVIACCSAERAISQRRSRLPHECLSFAARREEIKHSVVPLAARKSKLVSPLPLDGPYRLEGATLSKRLAASRNYYKHPRSLLLAPCPAEMALMQGTRFFSAHIFGAEVARVSSVDGLKQH